MLVINARNAEHALVEASRKILIYGVERPSRNGKVLAFPTPVTTAYSCPTERVVFFPERDANPFFHLMEAIWMLAGRNDVETIRKFNSSIDQFSDDGVTFNGAYGHRWRNWFDYVDRKTFRSRGMDQILRIADALKRDPTCRRQVMTMFDPRWDPFVDTKDVPCNTHIYFRVGAGGGLDMTVCNRSNDLVWGCYGANVVHFSLLQEVMAALIGLPPGTYWQVSNDLHVYERHFKLIRQLASRAGEPPSRFESRYEDGPRPYRLDAGEALLLLREADAWLRGFAVTSKFLLEVAGPLRTAYERFRGTEGEDRYVKAIDSAKRCAAPDWREACVEWLSRRYEAWMLKK